MLWVLLSIALVATISAIAASAALFVSWMMRRVMSGEFEDA